MQNKYNEAGRHGMHDLASSLVLLSRGAAFRSPHTMQSKLMMIARRRRPWEDLQS
jgi:hypothetical protein